MEPTSLEELERKVEQLILLCEELFLENKQLKSSQSKWQDERIRLREKNDLARSRVDNMISRLKSLEQES
jgi:cell division protein ZapB